MLKCSKVKGFILVETMVVIAFLATTLLTVYSAFTTVLDNAKTRIFYDDPIYLYRTYYFLSFLGKNNLTEFIDTKFANTSGTDNRSLSIVEFGCNALSVTEASGGASSTGFCESLKSSMDINHVFFMHYDVNDVIACDEQSGSLADKTLYCQRNKALQNLSISAVNYLYTLDGYTGSSTPEAVKASGYRIVMEFKKAKTKTYHYFDYNKSTTNKETMQETTYNYYYTTLRVPYGYDDRSKTTPILRRTYQGDTYAYKDSAYKTKIKTLTFNTSWSDTSAAVKVWDVGVEPGTVQAYIKNSPTYRGYYDLYIEGDGELYANKDSSYLIYSLTELMKINNLSLLDTSYTTNMSYMFSEGAWSSLTSLDLSGLDTSNVTNMSSMFRGNTDLTSLNISGLDTRNVTNMESMFATCWSLVHLNLSSFNTSKVTNMARMFTSSTDLISLDLSNFDTRNVTDMSGMFEACLRLVNLNISSFNTSKVTNMSRMFESISSISLDLRHFDTSMVTDMSWMFADCYKLTSLNVSSFSTSKVTDMWGMFSGCQSLPSLDVSNFDTRNVTDMSAMFEDCRNLTSLDLSNFDTSNVRYLGTKSAYSLKFLSDGSFSGGNFTGSGMFADCSNLKSLDLSNFNTDRVIGMGSMFKDCTSLVSLDISSFNTQYVKNMELMFYRTNNLTDYKLPVFDVRSATEMRGMFGGSKIDSVKMNSANFNSSVRIKPFVIYGQQLNLTVKSNRDKMFFDSLNEPYLKVTVSAN